MIVGESRQPFDRTNRFGFLGASGEVPVYRIVTPSGVEIKGYSKVAEDLSVGSMWHGVGVTSNGFAIRWNKVGVGPTMRLFDNEGNPTSGDIVLAAAAGLPGMGGGGRGDGAGFHGNGTDAYVHACTFGGTVFVGVYNANGTLRWARRVADQDDTPNTDRLDAAIHPDGRVVVIFDATNRYPAGPNPNRTVCGRMFDRFGEPLGPIFYVSENENPAPVFLIGTAQFSKHARVAWRDNLLAVAWESASGPLSLRMVGLRMFDTPAYTPVPPGDIEFTLLSRSGTDLNLVWKGGSPPFKIQKKTTIDGSWADVVTGLSYRNGTVSITGSDEGYYRVVGQGPL